MTRNIIYLECPYCGHKTLKSVLIGKKWNPEKTVICGGCDCDSEISEWDWYEKHMVPFFRRMSVDEVRSLV